MPVYLCHHDSPEEQGDDQPVRRRRSTCLREVIYLTHTLETKLTDVGLQVWPGCLLLCDYLLSEEALTSESVVLELGAGVGLASIIAAIQATKVIATDIGDNVLKTCEKNLAEHQYMYHRQTPYIVREMNFFHAALKEGSGSKHGWSETDKEWLHKVDTIVAADVIYDGTITDALFKTLERLVSMTSVKSVVIALEQRLNFTFSELDVSCPAYDHFQEHLRRLSSLREDTPQLCSEEPYYQIEQLETQRIPQHFHSYTRSKYLELWKISVIRKDSLENEQTAEGE